MRFLERGLQVNETLFLQRIEIRQGAVGVHVVDQRTLIKLEAWQVADAKPFCQFVDDEYVGARIRMGFDQFRPEHHVLLAAAAINIVMLKKSRCRQKHIRHPGGVGHELLVNRNKEILTRKSLTHQPLFRCDIYRIGILDQHCRNRRPAIERLAVTGQDPADFRLVEITDAVFLECPAFDLALVHAENAGIGVEGPAAFILKSPGYAGDRCGCMHVDRTVALAREAVAKAEIGALCPAHEMGKSLDLPN